MPQRPPSKPAAPAEALTGLNLGYNAYSDPTETNPKMWAFATNVYSGAFSYIQRSRFANVLAPSPLAVPLGNLEPNVAILLGGVVQAVPTGSYYARLYIQDTFGAYFASPEFGPFAIDPTHGFRIVLHVLPPNALNGFLFYGTTPGMENMVVNVGIGGLSNFLNTAAGVSGFPPPGGTSFVSLKYFALPGIGAYLMGDINGKLYSYDTGANYAQTQRFNPYVDPAGTGNTQLNGPWSREALQNILYEMNGQVKQAGRLANAATIEGWGLDSPDASMQITLVAGGTQALTSIQRLNGIVTLVVPALPGGIGTVTALVANIINVSDPTFNGSWPMFFTGGGPYTTTWSQIGQDTGVIATGSLSSNIVKSVGRSYAWAWENVNKSHVGAISPITQYIVYNNQGSFLDLTEPGTISIAGGSNAVVGTSTQFSAAWVGRCLKIAPASGTTIPLTNALSRITSVTDATHLTINGTIAAPVSGVFQVYDPQATHVRLYATADGGATYFLIARNAFNPAAGITNSGLRFFDFANSEPPSFPFSSETAQLNNLPPPVGTFVKEYQGRLAVFGVPGALQSFFYTNVEATLVGQPQESCAPLNQVTLPIQNAQLNGFMQLPGSAIVWSDKQDMFRVTGLLTDNLVSATATQQGAQISRLPYALGCASPYAVTVTSLGGFWLTPNDEIWLFTDRYAPRNVGRPIQDILQSMAPGAERLAKAVYYHTANRNWLCFVVAANGSTYNNTILVLDLDLLASNGEASYYTFDMATNSPAWWVFQPGTVDPGTGNWLPRCDVIEVVYETGGLVRIMCGQVNLIQDIDYVFGGFGTEIAVPNGTVTLHPFGNESPFLIKRPTFVRFNTNRDPSMLATDGWSFAVQGIDDDFYTFFNPLTLNLVPGQNDTSALCGNPDFTGGLAFRHSPELFRIGGVNFVMGRRLKFQINFPSAPGSNYQLRSIQMGYGANPPN